MLRGQRGWASFAGRRHGQAPRPAIAGRARAAATPDVAEKSAASRHRSIAVACS